MQSMRSRNDEEKAARREALLNSAQAVFFSQGFESTSMDDIASDAGFSRALLYVYFKDKKDIYRALRIRSVEKMRQRMLEYVEQAESGIEKVAQVGRAFVDFYRYDKDYFDCLSLNISLNNQSSSVAREATHDPASLEVEKKTMQVMIDALQTGIDDGTVDPDKVQNLLETAMFLRGSMHGIILLQDKDGSAMLDKSGLDRDYLMEHSIQRVTSTLKPENSDTID